MHTRDWWFWPNRDEWIISQCFEGASCKCQLVLIHCEGVPIGCQHYSRCAADLRRFHGGGRGEVVFGLLRGWWEVFVEASLNLRHCCVGELESVDAFVGEARVKELPHRLRRCSW